MGTVVPFSAAKAGSRPKRLRLQPVDSSAVEAIGYNGHERLLDIRYPSGEVYRYFDVSPQRHRALLEAESIGRYVNEHIKPNYRFEKLN